MQILESRKNSLHLRRFSNRSERVERMSKETEQKEELNTERSDYPSGPTARFAALSNFCIEGPELICSFGRSGFEAGGLSGFCWFWGFCMF